MTQKLIVIGAGMASGRMLDMLIESNADFEITLFNGETRGNYNRIMLSPVLAGDKTYDEIVTHDAEWYDLHNIRTRFGRFVCSIDRKNRIVTDDTGAEFAYDKLVFATGSTPFIIPLPGHDLNGVIAYRDLEDTEQMMGLSEGQKAVVIGGGLLGLEAAAGMAARGVEVTVVHIMGHLMERQLDEAAGYLLRRALIDKGITVKCAANSKEILGQDGKVRALLLDDGTELPCDLLVIAVGIRPNVKLAQDAGLAVGRGIHVDDQMLTSDAHVLAVGECVEHDGAIFGLVAPLYDQAKVAAQTLVGQSAVFVQKEVFTKLKVTGCDLFSAGDFADGEGREDIVFRDPARGVYRRLVIEDDVIIGAVFYGDTTDSNWFYGLVRDKTDISDMRETLIFGPAYQGTSPDPLLAVAALPRDAEICGCNGICKGQIEDAIAAGATDLGAVRAVTKASGSCGTCTGLVEQVLASTLGDDFVVPAASSICGCTDMTHEDVRRMIKSQKLTSMPAVWQECGWRTSCGCHVCRPALNFYLLADWPLDYADDPQSRFINERKHANIQKDGTYSVVPRMWGGITTPDELRAIADAADKFMVPTVKVTGGQRIDLLGVKGEDLPAIWADLNAAGMVSGHAYSKGLRTVKTCVGTDHCRFGTQDSTGLGIKLEQTLWGSWTPHKLKLGVSGCPRNCAEATCKDIGVVCVDRGYQISVGGAAGMDVRETTLIVQVASEDEAIAVIKAVTQLYRENAKYLDRIYKWMGKVGPEWITAQVEDVNNRAALVERFEISQSIYRKDPWAEHAQTKAATYQPVADLTLEAAE